ncbi:hypothetical protein U9M48_040384 [Paspalum notatum var. saurae]|uniref:Uncharacterized protein n=1 Tax=Paspalum notatum var. saurae TaxID=547442 RepID=A0AAQ3XD52_PASNO
MPTPRPPAPNDKAACPTCATPPAAWDAPQPGRHARRRNRRRRLRRTPRKPDGVPAVAVQSRQTNPASKTSAVHTYCLHEVNGVCNANRACKPKDEAFLNCLVALSDDLPAHIVDLLEQCIDNNGETDIHAVSDDLLLDLKKHVDKYLQEKEQSQQTKPESSENEAVNVVILLEEDVDICGNASPIMLDKDAQIKSSKCGSPRFSD